MKRFEIHLGCIYQHSNGSICCVENIVGEDIFVNSTSGELWCMAEDLYPLELDKGIIDFMSSITPDVNYSSVYFGTEFKKLLMQHITKDANCDHFFNTKYVHEAQLFIQLSRNEDIHEKLFNYLLKR